MDSASILAAMNMPPELAVAYLQSKGLQVTDSWRDMWQHAHRKAFTVARSAGFDVLKDIKDGLTEALEQGKSYKQFTNELTPTLQAKGWWGKSADGKQLGSPRRLKLIYEQNGQTAFMAGRYQGLSAATQTHPYWQYVAIMDTRTRPDHRVLHGRVFGHDDDAWDVAYPPNGFRCRCRVRPLSRATLKREGLNVSSAKGHIEEIERPRRDGSTVKVKRINLGDGVQFQPDVGFDYNPAKDYLGV